MKITKSQVKQGLFQLGYEANYAGWDRTFYVHPISVKVQDITGFFDFIDGLPFKFFLGE